MNAEQEAALNKVAGNIGRIVGEQLAREGFYLINHQILSLALREVNRNIAQYITSDDDLATAILDEISHHVVASHA